MLSRIKFEIDELVKDILDQLPTKVWSSATTTFLDPAFGGGQFLRAIESRLRAAGHSDENISGRVYGCESSRLNVQYVKSAKNKYRLVATLGAGDFLEKDFGDMKFDVIVGNPPYQDGTKTGGQNKIYNQFSKKSIDLLTSDGKIAFITPSSVLKESKRFSLIGISGLKFVNFNANNYFPNVGVNVCSWLVDKTHSGPVTVYSKLEDSLISVGSSIYDPFEIDYKFAKIYESLKHVSKSPEDRMFKQNPVDASIAGRSKVKTIDHVYPVYKIDAGVELLVQYNKPVPKLHGKKKFVISLTKSLNENSCVISTNDFDVNHMFIDVNSDIEIANIKSFIFSEYFIEHSSNFKKLDGYGFNNSLKYLPRFDKTKKWNSEQVKFFIESYVK